MTVALLLGAGFGLGLYCLAAGLRRQPPSLATVVARLDPAARGAGMEWGSGSRAAVAAEKLGIGAPGSAEADLRLVGRSGESLAAERLTIALVGLVLGSGCAQVLASSGLSVPLGAHLAAALVLSGVGATLPLFTLRSVAAGRRREARVAVGAYLDLVGVALSGGAGVEEAMLEAARTGDGWIFDELGDALARARRAGEPPWVALDRLGAELGLTELGELSATLCLVGTEGARARETLLAKSRTLRRDLLAESEARALRRTEAAHLPLVLQLFGFVLLLLYPAFLKVVAGLS